MNLNHKPFTKEDFNLFKNKYFPQIDEIDPNAEDVYSLVAL